MNDSVRRLVEAIEKVCPLGANGFGDYRVWQVFRQHGYHADANEWARLTNEIREALYEVKKGE